MYITTDMRGFMSHKGIPDMPRSSRLILKDYVNGKLLYCYPPPGILATDFNKYDLTTTFKKTDQTIKAVRVTQVRFMIFLNFTF